MRFLIYARYGNGNGIGYINTTHHRMASKGDTLLYDGTEYLIYDSEMTDLERAIINPKLKIELNKAGALDFSIMPTHPLYDFFRRLKTYVRVVIDEEEVFRGRVLEIETEEFIERKVSCEGDLAYLIDSVQEPDQKKTTTTNDPATANNTSARNSLPASEKSKMPAESITVPKSSTTSGTPTRETVKNHLQRLIQSHNSQVDADKAFTLGDVTVNYATISMEFSASNYRSTKSAIDEDLQKYYGGFLTTRRSSATVYIDWLKTPGSNASQQIKMGLNLIELQHKAGADDIFTRLIPTGENGLTIESVNNNVKYIQNDAAYNLYGPIYKVESFTGVTTAAQLKTKATQYMNNYCKDNPLSLTVKAIDMHMIDSSIEQIKLGSKVRIVNPYNGLFEDVSLYVTSIEYDIQNPENNSYEIGDPYEPLSTRNKNAANSANSATAAARSAAGFAEGNYATLSQVINRHAENIVDIADKTYTLQADTIKVTARTLTVETDLADIHAKALTITSNTVRLNADYAVIGNTIIGGSSDENPYELQLIGNTMLYGNLTVGGTSIYCNRIDCNPETEDGGIYINGVPIGDNANSVAEFGEVTSQNGTVTIPYTMTDGTEGSINFNIADMAYFQSAVSAARSSGKASMGVTADTSEGKVKVAEGSTKEFTITCTSPTFTYNSTGHYYRASASAKAGDNVMHTVISLENSGTQAYDDGRTAGKAAMGVTADTSEGKIKVAEGSTKEFTITCTSPTFTYNSTGHYYRASASAKAGDNVMHTAISLTNSGTQAYDDGYAAGQAAGGGTHNVSLSRTSNLYNDTDNNIPSADETYNVSPGKVRWYSVTGTCGDSTKTKSVRMNSSRISLGFEQYEDDSHYGSWPTNSYTLNPGHSVSYYIHIPSSSAVRSNPEKISDYMRRIMVTAPSLTSSGWVSTGLASSGDHALNGAPINVHTSVNVGGSIFQTNSNGASIGRLYVYYYSSDKVLLKLKKNGVTVNLGTCKIDYSNPDED